MKNLKLASALLFSFFILGAWTSTSPKNNSVVSFYEGSYNDFLREAKKLHKPVLIDFWASWSAPCQRMGKETYSDSKLAAYLNENYLVYKVDIDSFDGMEIVQKFEIKSFPSIIIANYKGREVAKLKGFYAPSYLEETLEDLNKVHQLYEKKEKQQYVMN